MSYRDDQAALQSLRDELRRDLAEATRKAEALAGAGQVRDDLTRELASVEARLDRARLRQLPLLESIKIASPCDASWEAMVGDARVRFCGSCQKNVYNLSAMASAEAEQLLARTEGSLCVRLYERADGKVLTTDCPVGVRKKRVKRVKRTVAVAGAAGALATMAFGTLMMRMGAPVRQGEMRAPYPTISTAAPPVMGSAAVETTPVMGGTAAVETPPLMGTAAVQAPAAPLPKPKGVTARRPGR